MDNPDSHLPRERIEARRLRNRILNLHGTVYGLLWGLAATGIIGVAVGVPPIVEDAIWSRWSFGTPLDELIWITACAATGIPVGILVTRTVARWLEVGSAWRLLGVAPACLLMGATMLGFMHGIILEAYGWIVLGQNLRWNLPICLHYAATYAYASFMLFILPVPLAFLNCCHLREILKDWPNPDRHNPIG
jgi:hypothetical protein